jgi:cytochrome c-type biogenesis protein CcmH/NrfG
MINSLAYQIAGEALKSNGQDRKDKFAGALILAEVNEAHSPENTDFIDSLGEIRFLAGDLDGARISFLRALELDPEWLRSEYFLARIEEQEGEVDKAVSRLRGLVLRLDEKDDPELRKLVEEALR